MADGAAEDALERAAESGERRGDRESRRQQIVGGGEFLRPGEEVGRGQAGPKVDDETLGDGQRVSGLGWARAAAICREDGGRRDGESGRDDQHRRSLSLEIRQRFDELATAGHESHSPGEEERDVGPETGGERGGPGGRERGAPRLQGGGDRRGRVAAAAAESRGHGNALREARGEGRRVGRAAGPGGVADGRAGGADSPQDEVVGRGRERQARDPQGIAARPGWRR